MRAASSRPTWLLLAILAVASGPAPPATPTPLERAWALLPRFQQESSRHFVLVHDTSRRVAQHHLAHLERAYAAFGRSMERLGLVPGPLRHKLVAVLFRQRSDYVRFARQHDGFDPGWMHGYFQPRDDRVVFYQPQSGDDEFAVSRTVATTLHEASHQLLFHTGVQTIYVQYPLWICEGLATCFETTTPDRAFGLHHEHPPRRRHFETLRQASRLLPLRQLVTLDRIPADGSASIEIVYHQSYALVAWLVKREPDRLRTYLERMRTEPPGQPTAARHLEIFTESFGDPDLLEQRWLAEEAR